MMPYIFVLRERETGRRLRNKNRKIHRNRKKKKENMKENTIQCVGGKREGDMEQKKQSEREKNFRKE